jgi:hypothetical protein
MDSTLLQLFALDEILERLAAGERTGCLHIFTAKDSANIFFKQGQVVAAAKGLVEGEEVLKQVVEWPQPRAMWQPEVSAEGLPFKPVQLNIAEFLAKRRASAKPAPLAKGERPFVMLGAIKAPLTGPVPLRPAAAVSGTPVSEAVPVPLTSTKTMRATSQLRLAQEQALLEKFHLALISTDDPEQKIKISRASTLLGRNPACDIALDHGSISRQHCLLQLTDRGLHVKDLGTTNGTKVNGIAMTEGYINVGDKLTIGHLGFVLQQDEE